MTCEQYQVPCLGLFNNYNQADESLSDVSIPECFQFGLAGIKDSFPVRVFEDLPLPCSNACKCSKDSRGHPPTFRVILADSLQRLISCTPIIPLQKFCSESVASWIRATHYALRTTLNLFPTIVLII